MKQWCIETKSEAETIALGKRIGEVLKGGEVIELSSDLGGGKTTLTKGIAEGVGSTDIVSSPTFTISNEYAGSKLRVKHYDFYRLDELGVMADEITEVMADGKTVSVVEWAGEAHELFDSSQLIRIELKLVADDEHARNIVLHAGEDVAPQIETLELATC